MGPHADKMPSPTSRLKTLAILALIVWLQACQGLPTISDEDYRSGVIHEVQKGQTLYSIARVYEVEVSRLIRINRIEDPTAVPIGARLWIPGAKRVLEVSPTVGLAPAARKLQPAPGKKTAAAKGIRKPHAIKKGFAWPVRGGTLTSGFGKRHGRVHEGIDIAAKKGTPIHAAGDGRVMFSGWGPTGYGLMIIIEHPGRLTTLYAHNAQNWVKKNTNVRKGQKIGAVGSTGRSTGPHLHFEVRNSAQPKNPLIFLP